MDWFGLLDSLEVVVKSLKAPIPKAAIGLEPLCDRLQRFSLKMAGSPLRFPAPRNQARSLQHFEMFRDCGEAHVIRLGKLTDARIPEAEPGKDAAACWIGEGGERGAEAVSHCIQPNSYQLFG